MSKTRISFLKVLKSNKGGLATIIAIVVSIIMVLSLVSYSLLNQVAGAKATADNAAMEQQKINIMLQNPNIVTGNVVKDYMRNETELGISVTVDGISSGEVAASNIVDSVLYKMTKDYNEDGLLSSIEFEQLDLSWN